MTSDEYTRKTAILRARLTRSRNRAKENVSLEEKVVRLQTVKYRQRDLDNHLLMRFELVTD